MSPNAVGRRIRVALLVRVLLVLGIPGEEVRRRRVGERLAALHEVEQVTAVVLATGVGADVTTEAAERRRDDADVHVGDGVELGLRAGGAIVVVRLVAVRVRRRGARGRDAGRRVGALRLEEADEEVRHGVREDRLLVTHRCRVVDHEEEVDLVDLLLRDGRREVDLRRRRLLADRAREAARAAAPVAVSMAADCKPLHRIDYVSTSSRAPSACHASRPPSARPCCRDGGPSCAGAVSTISRQTSTSHTQRRSFA